MELTAASPVLIEALGYAGTLVILVSLMMKSLVKFRWINAVGSLLLVAFAIATGSWPVVAMNLGIIAIDLYFIARLSSMPREYKLVAAERDSALLLYFYAQNRGEITALFGETAFADARYFTYFVRGSEVAGLFAWRDSVPGECLVSVDFVTPRYRDTSIGRYFFGNQLPAFRDRGYSRIAYRNVGYGHWKYLRSLGFKDLGGGDFEKDI